MAADESGFEIEGRLYPIPTFESFTMAEAQVLYDYSGLAIEDFAAPDPDSSEEEQREHEVGIIDKAKNPAFKTALAHIAYQRGNPETSPSRVREIVGGANMLGIALALAGEGEGQGDPTPSSPLEPAPSLDTKTLEKSEGFGSLSGSDLDGPGESPAPIGISKLDTSLTSGPVT